MHKEIIGKATLYHGDCRELIPQIKADAVITDPPYGIDFSNSGGFSQKSGWNNWRGTAEWDKQRPSKDVFDLMLACAETVIIWGGNYFTDFLPPTMGWLLWDKVQRGFSLADGEMAWSNQNKALRIFSYARGNESGFAPKRNDGWQNSHPTQKPVALMKWCIMQAGKPPITFDPFAGSGTTGVAAVEMGYNFVGCEIEQQHFDTACQRIEEAQRQLQLAL